VSAGQLLKMTATDSMSRFEARMLKLEAEKLRLTLTNALLKARDQCVELEKVRKTS
jgi:hypothetical protein